MLTPENEITLQTNKTAMINDDTTPGFTSLAAQTAVFAKNTSKRTAVRNNTISM